MEKFRDGLGCLFSNNRMRTGKERVRENRKDCVKNENEDVK